MRITLRQLQIFCAVAQSGSTSAAADSVALSQSATSSALNELEHLLGAQLFDRVGKRLTINDNGRALHLKARELIEQAKTIESYFSGKLNEEMPICLKLAASTTIGNYLLPSMLASFKKKHPTANITLEVGNTMDVATAVSELQVDLGFIEGPCHVLGLKVVPWLVDELVLIASPNDHLVKLDNDRRLSLQQLREAPWILREVGSGTREATEQALIPHLQQLDTKITLSSTESIKNAVAAGMGVSCLSYAVVKDLVALGRLVVLTTTLPKLTRQLYLVHHGQKKLSDKLQEFFDHCLKG